jgi:hypothetical protein
MADESYFRCPDGGSLLIQSHCSPVAFLNAISFVLKRSLTDLQDCSSCTPEHPRGEDETNTPCQFVSRSVAASGPSSIDPMEDLYRVRL